MAREQIIKRALKQAGTRKGLRTFNFSYIDRGRTTTGTWRGKSGNISEMKRKVGGVPLGIDVNISGGGRSASTQRS